MRIAALVVATLIAVPVVWWLLHLVLGFFGVVFHLAMGLVYLALFLGVCVFVIGLIRRIVRV